MGHSPSVLARLKRLKEEKSLLQNMQSSPRVSRGPLGCFPNGRDPTRLPSLSPADALVLLSQLGLTGVKLLWLLGFFFQGERDCMVLCFLVFFF